MWICQTCLHDRVKSRRSGRVTAEAALCFQWVVSEAHDVHSVGEVDFNLSLKKYYFLSIALGLCCCLWTL